MLNFDLNSAIFSEDRIYRYLLLRKISKNGGRVLFVCLNPSTADESKDDPTIRRCIGFARYWGFSGLIVANLFAYRATSPEDLKKALDPVGPKNDDWLRAASSEADLTVVAWGNHGLFKERFVAVLPLLSNPKCFGVTNLGMPRHPLYISRSNPLVELPEV